MRARVFAVLMAVASSLPGATITVNTASDVVNPSDGVCSLREAITSANTNTRSGPDLGLGSAECIAGSAGLDRIAFGIAGGGVHTITLTTALGALPAITEPVTIDGYSQPGSVMNSAASGWNGTLLIQIVGTNAGVGANGFDLTLNG